jgi:hypothetical protein
LTRLPDRTFFDLHIGVGRKLQLEFGPIGKAAWEGLGDGGAVVGSIQLPEFWDSSKSHIDTPAEAPRSALDLTPRLFSIEGTRAP